MGGLCVANGDGHTFKLGAACNPSNVPLGALGVQPARRRRPGRREGQGRGPAAAGLPVPRHADPRRALKGACHANQSNPGGAVDRGARRRLRRWRRGDDPAPATSEVPASASASVDGFVDYLKKLVASSADMLESVDTAAVTGPTDETSEPQQVD